jgi:mono/diheme cytochrome c family protein
VIRTSILLLALASLALPAAAQSNGDGAKPVNGSFTEDQSARGENVYKALCASCHTPSDQSGDQFKLNWFGKTLFDYFANLKKTMPDDNPGGLSDDEYVRVVAYIMKLNGFRAGADSLAADSTAMKLIKIGPPDSTKPRNFR